MRSKDSLAVSSHGPTHTQSTPEGSSRQSTSRNRGGTSQSPSHLHSGRTDNALGGSIHSAATTDPQLAMAGWRLREAFKLEGRPPISSKNRGGTSQSPSHLHSGRTDDALGGSIHSTTTTDPLAGWRLREASKLESRPSSSNRDRGGRSQRDDAKGLQLLPDALRLAAQKSSGGRVMSTQGYISSSMQSDQADPNNDCGDIAMKTERQIPSSHESRTRRNELSSSQHRGRRIRELNRSPSKI